MSQKEDTPRRNTPEILHLVEYEKFIPPFIDLINENFDARPHHFFFFAKGERYGGSRAARITRNCDFRSPFSLLLSLVRTLNGADKIIVHGLFSSKIIALLFLQPWLLHKCYWVIWGGDLYTYSLGKRDWRWRIKEVFRRPVIRHFGHLISYGQSDLERARKWYGARGRFHECFMYTTNLYHSAHEAGKDSTVITIQVGNSADPSNEHLEALERLAPFRHLPIRIIVPLSYGDKDYAAAVSDYGRRIFGEKFVPLQDFLPFSEYRKLQSDTDIALFIHHRQQAMGNIIALLGMGKRVYLRKDTPNWKTFEALGIKVFDVEKLVIDAGRPAVQEANIEIVREVFSLDALVKQLSNIFEN